MILHEEKNFILRDMFDKERSYHYIIHNLIVKKGKNETLNSILIFYTYHGDGDDTLRYIEDVAEEICKIHNISPIKVTIYEFRENIYYEIKMNFDSNRFRGVSWVPLTSEEKEELLQKIL